MPNFPRTDLAVEAEAIHRSAAAVTELPGVQVGDEVEIFGRRARVDDLAALAGTIPYELTCAVSKRVPRVYLQGGKVVEKELLLRM